MAKRISSASRRRSATGRSGEADFRALPPSVREMTDELRRPRPMAVAAKGASEADEHHN
jgi:hypothetical protein